VKVPRIHLRETLQAYRRLQEKILYQEFMWGTIFGRLVWWVNNMVKILANGSLIITWMKNKADCIVLLMKR